MRGAKHLTWSRGLKRKHGIVERTDGELAGDEDPVSDSLIVAVLTVGEWKMAQQLQAECWLLEQTEKGGAPLLAWALRQLRARLTAAR